MRVTESCAACLYDKQKHLTDDACYLAEIRNIIENRGEEDTSPYLVYRFNQVYESHFGSRAPYGAGKKKYNDLVLLQRNRRRQPAAVFTAGLTAWMEFTGGQRNADHRSSRG